MLEATVDSPDTYKAKEDDISLFCRVTGDDNKVHEQGPNQIVPGFWLDFKAKSHFDKLAQQKSPLLNFAGLDIKFRDVLYKDQEFKIEHVIIEDQTGSLTYKISAVREGMPIAEGIIRYASQLENPENAKLDRRLLPYKRPGQPFALNEEYHDGVAEALRIGHQDKIAGAVSKISHALQKDPESKEILFSETQGNRYPYFVRHDLTTYAGIDEALDRNGVIIHAKKGVPKLGSYPVYVRGIDASNTPLFDLTATIRFLDK